MDTATGSPTVFSVLMVAKLASLGVLVAIALQQRRRGRLLLHDLARLQALLQARHSKRAHPLEAPIRTPWVTRSPRFSAYGRRLRKAAHK